MAVFALSVTSVAAQDANVKSRGLFVKLTTDGARSAAKAISFAHESGHRPVAIWLNVRAVCNG